MQMKSVWNPCNVIDRQQQLQVIDSCFISNTITVGKQPKHDLFLPIILFFKHPHANNNSMRIYDFNDSLKSIPLPVFCPRWVDIQARWSMIKHLELIETAWLFWEASADLRSVSTPLLLHKYILALSLTHSKAVLHLHFARKANIWFLCKCLHNADESEFKFSLSR